MTQFEQMTLEGLSVKQVKEQKRQVKKHVDLLVFALQAPTIAYSGQTDAVTPELKNRNQTERLAKIMRRDFSEEATDHEAMVYLMSASFAAPLSDPFVEIYMHLFCKFYGKRAKGAGIDDPGLDLYAASELKRLKEFIYRKQKPALLE